MSAGTGCRALSTELGKEEANEGRREHGQEGLALNSRGLKGHPTSLPAGRASWVLPASGPRLRGSARLERGQGTVSWRTCLAFSSVHFYLGRFSLPCVLLGENSACLAPHSGRDWLNFKGPGPTFCLINRSHPRTTPSSFLAPGPTHKNP